MQCKNCSSKLRTDYSYCPNCGAKVIRNRITVKNLWFDIIDRYFNLDNTFLKTFLHLFTKPQMVIEGYLQGIRRKYLNPISYLGISLTLSGFLIFLMKKNADALNFDVFGAGLTQNYQDKVFGFVFDYQAIFFVLYIPMMAIGAWLCFQNKRYNFSERIVIFMYTLAHYSMATLLPSILVLLIIPEKYLTIALFSILLMYVYSGYVIKKISGDEGIEVFAKIVVFYFLFTCFYFAFSAMIPILLLITGEISLVDMLPAKN